MVTVQDLIEREHYTKVNAGTKQAHHMLWDLKYAKESNITSILDAYNKCSQDKIDSFCKIDERARIKQGAKCVYIAGHGCTFYSTIYTLTVIDENTNEYWTAVIKDTYQNTYVLFTREV